MSFDRSLPPTTTERGIRLALIFALAAERLTLYYEHGKWLTEAQATSLAGDWLGRSKRQLAVEERRRLAALSDRLARQIEGSVSREAGLFISHEMNEALDPNHQSELALSLMAECERLLDEAGEA
ncbi:MAG: hypothetical protein PHW25_18675 [Zoogloea sp.]|uniref:hypothetical protein n=1 Tax=Zoogloea sp. TaxID=49181 RepID=UPI002608779A|nr:hypothetical protein [Zoogloea sp.]MDD3329109.1 hypothetical protein [Zoogloea sp.]